MSYRLSLLAAAGRSIIHKIFNVKLKEEVLFTVILSVIVFAVDTIFWRPILDIIAIGDGIP